MLLIVLVCLINIKTFKFQNWIMLKFAFIKLYNIFLKKIEKYKNDRYKWRYSKQWPSLNKRSFLHRFVSFLAYICCYIRVSNFPPEFFPAQIVINGKKFGRKGFVPKKFSSGFFSRNIRLPAENFRKLRFQE